MASCGNIISKYGELTGLLVFVIWNFLKQIINGALKRIAQFLKQLELNGASSSVNQVIKIPVTGYSEPFVQPVLCMVLFFEYRKNSYLKHRMVCLLLLRLYRITMFQINYLQIISIFEIRHQNCYNFRKMEYFINEVYSI